MKSVKIVGVYGFFPFPHPNQFAKQIMDPDHLRLANYFDQTPCVYDTIEPMPNDQSITIIDTPSRSDQVWFWPYTFADRVKLGIEIPLVVVDHVRSMNFTPPTNPIVCRLSETDVDFYWLWWCFFHSRLCFRSLMFWIVFPALLLFWCFVYFCAKRKLFDSL
jgi:hypothetical protein